MPSYKIVVSGNIIFFFFFLSSLVPAPAVAAVAPLPEEHSPPQPTDDEPAICSLVDILMSQRNPEIELKEYFCYSF